jgi:hypothetical protein
MVREGPAEPAPPSAADTSEPGPAQPFGMLVGAAAVTIAVVIVVAFLIR